MSPSRFNDEPRKMWSVCSCLQYLNCKCMRSWFLFELFTDLIMLRSEIRAACVQSFTPWQQATQEFTCHDNSIIACSHHIYVWCCSSRTSRSWWITQSSQHHRRGCNNIPSFLQQTTPIAHSLCEGWTPHYLHILVTATFSCDWKSRAACAQSFASWQQVTIEFTCHDHSVIACSRHIYGWCCSSRTSRSWWITQLTQHYWKVATVPEALCNIKFLLMPRSYALSWYSVTRMKNCLSSDRTVPSLTCACLANARTRIPCGLTYLSLIATMYRLSSHCLTVDM